MNLLKKLMPFAGMILSATPIAPFLPMINAVLPNEAKLSTDTPVQQAMDTIAAQPPDIQVKLNEIELGMEQEHTKQVQILAEIDGPGSSTRPEIAKGSFQVMAATTILIVSGVVYGFITKGLDGAESMLQIGIGTSALLAPFVIIVHKYFGVRTQEKNMRMAVGTGNQPPLGMIASIIGAIKK